MRRIGILAMLVCVATPAFSQSTRRDYGLSNGDVLRAGQSFELRNRVVGVARLGNGTVADANRQICLDRKKTGQMVCHTRPEWERIAAGMDSNAR